MNCIHIHLSIRKALGLCDATVGDPGLRQPAPAPVPTAHTGSPLAGRTCLFQPESPCSPCIRLSSPLGMLFLQIFAPSCHSGFSPKLAFSVRPAVPTPAKEPSPVHSNAHHSVSFTAEQSLSCGLLGFFLPLCLLCFLPS